MRAVPGGHVALEGGLAAVDVCGVSVGEVKSLGAGRRAEEGWARWAGGQVTMW